MYGIAEVQWGEYDSSTRIIATTTSPSLRDEWVSSHFVLDWKDRGNKDRFWRERVPCVVFHIRLHDGVEDFPFGRLIECGFTPVGRDKWSFPMSGAVSESALIRKIMDGVRAAVVDDMMLIGSITAFNKTIHNGGRQHG